MIAVVWTRAVARARLVCPVYIPVRIIHISAFNVRFGYLSLYEAAELMYGTLCTRMAIKPTKTVVRDVTVLCNRVTACVNTRGNERCQQINFRCRMIVSTRPERNNAFVTALRNLGAVLTTYLCSYTLHSCTAVFVRTFKRES